MFWKCVPKNWNFFAQLWKSVFSNFWHPMNDNIALITLDELLKTHKARNWIIFIFSWVSKKSIWGPESWKPQNFSFNCFLTKEYSFDAQYSATYDGTCFIRLKSSYMTFFEKVCFSVKIKAFCLQLSGTNPEWFLRCF